MDNREIAKQIIDNVAIGGQKLEAVKAAVQAYVTWVAQTNKSIMDEIGDEKDFLEVSENVADILLPDAKLAAAITVKAPFWLKPFVNIIVSVSKIPLLACVAEGLDKAVLDKYLSPQWFLKLKALADEAK